MLQIAAVSTTTQRSASEHRISPSAAARPASNPHEFYRTNYDLQGGLCEYVPTI